MIQKIKLDFTSSVNLRPIIVDIITTTKTTTKKRCSSSDRTSNASISYTSKILVLNCSSLSDIPFVDNFHVSKGQKDFLSTLFETSYSLAFKLVLQNHFHGLSSTIVRFLSDKCVFLNFVLRLSASLTT